MSNMPSLEKRINLTQLYDLYAPALTERQREVFELHEIMDLSLGEISERIGVSRQGVHDFLQRAMEKLVSMDEELRFSARIRQYEAILEDLKVLIVNYRNILPGEFLEKAEQTLGLKGE